MDDNFQLSGWSSLAVHGGHVQDPMYAHLVPIYASSTFVFDDAEQGMRRFSKKEEGYIYSRWGNPTFTEAENKIAAMETFGIEKNGSPLEAKAILHASGMAAIKQTFQTKSGSQITLLQYDGIRSALRREIPRILLGLDLTPDPTRYFRPLNEKIEY